MNNHIKTIEVFSVGSFVMGLTMQVKRRPVSGESILGYNFDFGPGGKGFNQAIAAKRAGAVVHTSLCIGKDLFGREALKFLKAEGLYNKNIFQIQNIPTGCGFITLTGSGENTIVINPGANAFFSPDLLGKSDLDIKKSKVLLAQMEVPFDTVREAILLGKKYGCITILNPAPAKELIKELLNSVDILTPNQTEAKMILSLEPDATISNEELIKGLRKMGAKTIIITLGKDGVMLADNGNMEHLKAPLIKAIDSTGAGDSFNGNLAAGLGKGMNLREAVKKAIFAGAYCAEKLGVIQGLPSSKELSNYMLNKKFKT